MLTFDANSQQKSSTALFDSEEVIHFRGCLISFNKIKVDEIEFLECSAGPFMERRGFCHGPV